MTLYSLTDLSNFSASSLILVWNDFDYHIHSEHNLAAQVGV